MTRQLRLTTPQALIDAWRPHRETMRPGECDHRQGCWVIDPFGAVSNGTSRCKACRGKIGLVPVRGRGRPKKSNSSKAAPPPAT
jgi:hypothetical protein